MNGLILYRLITSTEQQGRLQRLIETFANHRMKVVTVQHDQVIRLLETTTKQFFSFAYFFDEDRQLALSLQNGYGLTVFNEETPINIANDRALLSLTLRNEGIPTPQTIVLPYTMNQSILHQLGDVKLMLASLAYPFLIKERFVSDHQPVYFIRDVNDLTATFHMIGLKPLLAQEYMGPVSRKVVKVFVVNRRPIASVEVISSSTQDTIKRIQFPSSHPVYQTAIKTADALGASMILIYMLVVNLRTPYVYGVKTNPNLLELEQVTGVDVHTSVVKAIQDAIK
jgi:glutathione synthase/RimK-type ligase-like ATP-grasp enzyme